MRKYPPPLLLLLLVMAPCAYFFFPYDFSVYLTAEERAIRFLQSLGPWSVVVFIALQAVQVIIAPIPGDVTGFIGGYLYGAAPGTVYSTVGLTLGSWLAFYFARVCRLPLVEKIARPDIIKKYDYFMEHKGRGVAFVFFLIPGFPKDALCYIIGLSHMPKGVFLLLSTAGRLFGTILLSVAGSSFRRHDNAALAFSAGAVFFAGLAAFICRERLLSALKKTGMKSTT